MKRNYHLYLFIVYILLANLLLYALQAGRSLLFHPNLAMFLRVALSFLGGVLLSLPALMQALRAGRRVLRTGRLLFAGVCLLLALSRLLLYTAFSRAPLNPLLLSLGSPFLEAVCGLCAGAYLAKAWEPAQGDQGSPSGT